MNIPKFTIAALSMTTAASAWAVNSDVSNRHVVMDPSSSLSTKAAETPLSDLLDLTDVLGPKVAEYNALNPLSPISLLAKAEFRNPASKSHKDRIARAIIREAACRGDLTRKDGGKKTSEFYGDGILYIYVYVLINGRPTATILSFERTVMRLDMSCASSCVHIVDMELSRRPRVRIGISAFGISVSIEW